MAGDGVAPTVGVLATHETRRLYKWHSKDGWWYKPPLQMGRFVGAAHSPAATVLWFVGVAQSPAAPTNGIVEAAGDTSRPYK